MMQPENQHMNPAIYEQAQAEARASGDKAKYALASNDLGVTCVMAGRYDDARRALADAREGFAACKDAAGEARATGNLARLEERLGRSKAALGLYQQAADLFHEAGDFETESLTLRTLSQLHFKGGEVMMALATYTRALEVKPRRSAFDSLLLQLFRLPLRMMGGSPA